MKSFEEFADDFLVAAACLQGKYDQRAAEVTLIISELGYEAPRDWRMGAVKYWEERGCISSRDSDLKAIRARVTGEGLAKADRIRKARMKPTLWDRTKAVPRSDWIAAGAFIVSLIALFK